MTTTQEALKMAIEALENVYKTDDQIGFVENAWKNRDARIKAINACKEALEQQEQEPVAWLNNGNVEWIKFPSDMSKPVALYTHPAKQLRDDEIRQLELEYLDYVVYDEGDYQEINIDGALEFARAIEAKIRGE